MDLQSLTLLVEILDAGNLSAAARRLKMSRANVSYHLNQLERSVGAQLVRRTTQYPGIVLDVVFENRIEDLLRDEVDIAIRVIPEPPQNLVAREMGPVRYVACASSGYAEKHPLPVQLDELQGAPVVTAAVIGRQLRVSAYQGQNLGEVRREVILEPTLISENFLFLRQAILAGLGIGLVPDYVVQEDVRKGDVVTTLDDWRLSIFGTQMFMLYMPNRQHTRAIRTFIDFILERVRVPGAESVDQSQR
ncbi:MAG: LysR family transcriptional regulator [Burkholderiales bacterium]|nr:LysR family transcriptional regulator [Burkholderiales bacterium]